MNYEWMVFPIVGLQLFMTGAYVALREHFRWFTLALLLTGAILQGILIEELIAMVVSDNQ